MSLITMLLSLLFLLHSISVDGHFLFSELIPTKNNDSTLRVTFHEPGSEPSIKFVQGRLKNMMLYYYINEISDEELPIPLKENEDGTAMTIDNNKNNDNTLEGYMKSHTTLFSESEGGEDNMDEEGNLNTDDDGTVYDDIDDDDTNVLDDDDDTANPDDDDDDVDDVDDDDDESDEEDEDDDDNDDSSRRNMMEISSRRISTTTTTIPIYLTGFLDYGLFPEMTPPPDLQYTYSAQKCLSLDSNKNSNKNDMDHYWNTFYKKLDMTTSSLKNEVDDYGIFRFAFRNYGMKPYEILLYGSQEFQEGIMNNKNNNMMTICIYVASSGDKLGCQTNKISNNNNDDDGSIITTSWDMDNLKESESYLALANMTELNAAGVPSTLYYSSTSFVMMSSSSSSSSTRSSSLLDGTTTSFSDPMTIFGILMVCLLGIVTLRYICKFKQRKSKAKKYNSVKGQELFHDEVTDDDNEVFVIDDDDDDFELSNYKKNTILSHTEL